LSCVAAASATRPSRTWAAAIVITAYPDWASEVSAAPSRTASSNRPFAVSAITRLPRAHGDLGMVGGRTPRLHERGLPAIRVDRGRHDVDLGARISGPARQQLLVHHDRVAVLADPGVVVGEQLEALSIGEPIGALLRPLQLGDRFGLLREVPQRDPEALVRLDEVRIRRHRLAVRRERIDRIVCDREALAGDEIVERGQRGRQHVPHRRRRISDRDQEALAQPSGGTDDVVDRRGVLGRGELGVAQVSPVEHEDIAGALAVDRAVQGRPRARLGCELSNQAVDARPVERELDARRRIEAGRAHQDIGDDDIEGVVEPRIAGPVRERLDQRLDPVEIVRRWGWRERRDRGLRVRRDRGPQGRHDDARDRGDPEARGEHDRHRAAAVRSRRDIERREQLLERREHRLDRRVARRRIDRERPRQHAVDLERDVGPRRPVAQDAAGDRRAQLPDRRALERRLAVQRVVQCDREAELIGARIDRAAGELLGRHVARGAEQHPGPGQVVRLGDRHAVEIARAPGRSSSTAWGATASPKSLTAARPLRSTSTFSGLKSRCTTPAACAAASPRPTAMNIRRIACHDRGSLTSQRASVAPSTSSIAMNTPSSSSPAS